MLNQLLDAVKTAKSIHNGDYSSLHGKSFVIRVNMKKRPTRSGDKSMKKSRMDRLEESIAKLAKQMNARFDNLEDRVEDGFKQVNSRLDYIVKANKLKDLPKSK